MIKNIWRHLKNYKGKYNIIGCSLDYPYFKENRNLSKQKVLDPDPEAIQQINFTGNLKWDGNTQIFDIIDEAKETILDISKETVRVL